MNYPNYNTALMRRMRNTSYINQPFIYAHMLLPMYVLLVESYLGLMAHHHFCWITRTSMRICVVIDIVGVIVVVSVVVDDVCIDLLVLDCDSSYCCW